MKGTELNVKLKLPSFGEVAKPTRDIIQMKIQVSYVVIAVNSVVVCVCGFI